MGVRVALLRNKSRGSVLWAVLVAVLAGHQSQVTALRRCQGGANRLRGRLAGAGLCAEADGASAHNGLAVGAGAVGGVAGRTPAQAPVVTVRAWARVASRTKRATLPARIKMSPRYVALALLGKPYQGERLRWRRSWPALRLSA